MKRVTSSFIHNEARTSNGSEQGLLIGAICIGIALTPRDESWRQHSRGIARSVIIYESFKGSAPDAGRYLQTFADSVPHESGGNLSRQSAQLELLDERRVDRIGQSTDRRMNKLCQHWMTLQV